MMMIIAIFGNALSSYMLFWQTSEEAEESIVNNKRKEMGFRKPMISNREIKLVKVDVALSMAFAVFVMWSIMVTTGGSLRVHNIYEIQTAEQAAQALEPLVKTFPHSGEISKIIFVIGIIGTGLLAIVCFCRSLWKHLTRPGSSIDVGQKEFIFDMENAARIANNKILFN